MILAHSKYLYVSYCHGLVILAYRCREWSQKSLSVSRSRYIEPFFEKWELNNCCFISAIQCIVTVFLSWFCFGNFVFICGVLALVNGYSTHNNIFLSYDLPWENMQIKERGLIYIMGLVIIIRYYSPTGNSLQLRHNLFTYIFNHILFLLKEDCDFLTTMKCSWSP